MKRHFDRSAVSRGDGILSCGPGVQLCICIGPLTPVLRPGCETVK